MQIDFRRTVDRISMAELKINVVEDDLMHMKVI